MDGLMVRGLPDPAQGSLAGLPNRREGPAARLPAGRDPVDAGGCRTFCSFGLAADARPLTTLDRITYCGQEKANEFGKSYLWIKHLQPTHNF